MSATWLIEARHISKSFAGVRVLNDVCFNLRAGEVHALLGENGAGKSTLMKILAGIYTPDTGELRLHGQPVQFPNAHGALKAGVAMIYQELLPFLHLSVAENIFMGQEPASKGIGWIDQGFIRRKTKDLLSRLEVSLAPARKMRDLRVAEMQVVEIAKALAHRAQVIIMDEPTSALSEREAEALFRIVQDLQQGGTAIIYITHKLDEVFRLADRVTVLRDGSHAATLSAKDLSAARLIALMVGRELKEVSPRKAAAKGETVLSVRRLGKAGRFRNVSFDLHRGEVLGLAGLMGAGRTDVLNAIYGLEPADSGEILVRGRAVAIRRPHQALSAGIGLVTEDRRRFGFVPAMGVKRNLTLTALRQLCRGGFINHAAESRIAQERIRSLRVRATDPDQPVERLSGGNQQKVVLGRALLTEPQVLLLDEPTRGIDIAAKAEVHALVSELVCAGKAVVLASSELPELLSLCDRLLVLCQGSVTAELDALRTAPEEVLKFAMPG